MRIGFVSNFLNHHQTELCNTLDTICDEFYFIATKIIPQETLDLGYEDLNKSYSYVFPAYRSKVHEKKGKELVKSLDVVIFGSCDQEYIDLRMSVNKLSFIYSERLLKRGLLVRFIPMFRKKIYHRFLKYQNNNLFVLCASAYTAYDLSLFGWKKPSYRFGYFPEFIEYENKELLQKRNQDKVVLLWVGRMVPLKHGIEAIKLAKRLKGEGYAFLLQMIGTGSELSRLQNYVKKEALEDYVNFLGAMSPKKVRKYMEEADIFLFTSNFMEGWGAVLNEAMNSGSCVVASHAIGAAPYLIQHGINGFIYKYKNSTQFYKVVKLLMEDKNLREKMGFNAYKTIKEHWNGTSAAINLLKLIEDIQNNKNHETMEGPVSIAPLIKNNWMK